jgi:hypothetical protein
MVGAGGVCKKEEHASLLQLLSKLTLRGGRSQVISIQRSRSEKGHGRDLDNVRAVPE